MTFSYSVAIPTINRPIELRRCLRHVFQQKIKPHQVIILDDGNLELGSLKKWMGKYCSKLVYKKKQAGEKGTVTSYNLAAQLCQTPWLLILDDDIYIKKDFVDKLKGFLFSIRDHHNLGAICGYPVQPGARNKKRISLRRLLEKIFLINHGIEGRFLISSFCTDFQCGTRPNRPYRVEHLPAGLTLWRCDILRQFPYDSWYSGYAYGQDKDVAYQVSRHHPIYCHPQAIGIHRKSNKSRTPTKKLGKMKVKNQFYFFRKNFRQGPLEKLAFHWAIFGEILISFLGAATKPSESTRWQECKGMINAFFTERRPKK